MGKPKAEQETPVVGQEEPIKRGQHYAIYPDQLIRQQFEAIREYYFEREGVRYGDSELGKKLIREKFVAIRDATTKSLTLQKLYAEFQDHRLKTEPGYVPPAPTHEGAHNEEG